MRTGGARIVHRERRRGAEDPPPARYTEATLLSAMEGAGKLIDDDELRGGHGRKRPGHAGHARRPSSKA